MDRKQHEGKTLYATKKVAGIWMIRPCRCQYLQEQHMVAIKDGAAEARYSEKEFADLCKRGVYAESPQEAYELSMKQIIIEGNR